jgi:hypothetical protein
MENLENSYINDMRTNADFTSISFGNYKKTEVKKQFIDAITKNQIEHACYWCAELVCAGHFIEIWECFLFYLGKYIHSGNPKIVVYLDKRYKVFRNIVSQSIISNELELRNNLTIRQLFAEIIVVLTQSPKKHSFETLKIDRITEFDISQIGRHLKATNPNFGDNIMNAEDPKELFIIINEFTFQICQKNMRSACFWIEWIIEFEILCKGKKEPCKCGSRYYPVEHKFQKDPIWILWDVILKQGSLCGLFIENVLKSLLELFCIRYTSGCCKKRKYLFYFAIELLTEPVNTQIELITDKEIIPVILEKVNIVYKQVKKKEVAPKTDYLFHGLNSNVEQTMQKLELMREMDLFS